MRWLTATLIGLIAAAILYFGSAALALRSLAAAAAAGDAGAVIARTDVPRLRAHLVGQVAAAVLEREGRTRRLSDLERSVIGGVVASFADAAVAQLTEPAVLAELLRTGRAPAILSGASPELPSLVRVGEIDLFRLAARVRPFRPAEIAIRLDAGATPEDYAGVRLRFGGLGWQLSGLDIPRAVLDRLAAAARARPAP
jgi:hypothetical protein